MTTAQITLGGSLGILYGQNTTTGTSVTPGGIYRVGGWIRVSDTSERGAVAIRWKDASGATISDVTTVATANNARGSLDRLRRASV
jgi:hypothetical protein